MTPPSPSYEKKPLTMQRDVEKNGWRILGPGGGGAAQIEAALFRPCGYIEQILAQLTKTYGPRICVLPEGSQTIPYLVNIN